MKKHWLLLLIFIPVLLHCSKDKPDLEFTPDCLPDTMKFEMHNGDLKFSFKNMTVIMYHWDYGVNFRYKWSTGDTSYSIFVDKPGKYTVKTYFKRDGSFFMSEMMDIEFKELSLYIPSVFSPNNDKTNELFSPVGLHICKFYMKILDMDGKILFETNVYSVDENSKVQHGWDGKNKKGKVCPAGSYMYFIKCLFKSGDEKVFTGRIDLIR